MSPTRIPVGHTESAPLPDGSTVTVEMRSARHALVTRWVGDECVWGQAFGGSDVDDIVSRCLDEMAEHPADFERKLWDRDGRAAAAPETEAS